MKSIFFLVLLLSSVSCAVLQPAPKGEDYFLSGESVQYQADGKMEVFRLATLIKRTDVNKGEKYYEWLYLAPDASGKMQAYDSVATRIGDSHVYMITTKDSLFVGRLTFADETHNNWSAEMYAKAGHVIHVKGQKKDGVVTEEKKFVKFNGDLWFTIKTKFTPVTSKEFDEKLKAFKSPKG